MLYIMRHGRTDWNDDDKLQGRVDIPLNEDGKKMAVLAAEEYKGVHFDKCFCSPLLRAKETAELVLADRDIPIIYDDRLMEMSFGDYEGTSHYFNKEEGPLNLLFQHPEEYHGIPNGESFEALYKRTGDFLQEKVYPLIEKGEDILIIGHGAMNCSIICQVNNIDISDFWKAGIENCKLKKII